MSDIKEKITVEGNFKEQVQAFVNGLIKARMEFKNLIIGVSTGSKTINQTMTLAQRKIDKYASQLIKEGETVENAIKKATDKVEGYQAKSVDRLAKKYTSNDLAYYNKGNHPCQEFFFKFSQLTTIAFCHPVFFCFISALRQFVPPEYPRT